MKTTLAGGTIEFKLAATDTDTATFTGYGAVFNNRDLASDIIAPGAFAATLADHKAAGTLPQMFFNHDAYALPIGRWVSMEEDAHGLKVVGEFLDTTGGRDAYAAVKAGAVTGLSIGYIVTAYEMDGGVRIITQAKLIEISVVTFPCNELARVASVKTKETDMTDDELFEKLTELGIDAEDAKAMITKRGKSAEPDEDATGADDQPNDDEPEHEAKYDEAAVVAAIKTIVATIKETNVR